MRVFHQNIRIFISSPSQMFFEIGKKKSRFNKFAHLQASNFIRKRLQHRCFPANIAKFLRTAFFIEHLRCVCFCTLLCGNDAFCSSPGIKFVSFTSYSEYNIPFLPLRACCKTRAYIPSLIVRKPLTIFAKEFHRRCSTGS